MDLAELAAEHKSKVCGTIVATNHIRPQPKPLAFSRQGNYTQSYLPKHSIEWGREPGIHVTYDNIPYFLCSMTSILCQKQEGASDCIEPLNTGRL
jgi:hypothetical protein